MKVKRYLLSLLCVLFAAAAGTAARAADAAPSKSETRQTQELLRAFYVEYCTAIAGSGDSRAEQRLLDAHLTRQVLRKTEGLDYLALIRAQDFNAKDLETIAVTHVDGDWYAAGYFDSYGKSCVIVPVKVVVENGVLRITDITLP